MVLCHLMGESLWLRWSGGRPGIGMFNLRPLKMSSCETLNPTLLLKLFHKCMSMRIVNAPDEQAHSYTGMCLLIRSMNLKSVKFLKWSTMTGKALYKLRKFTIYHFIH